MVSEQLFEKCWFARVLKTWIINKKSAMIWWLTCRIGCWYLCRATQLYSLLVYGFGFRAHKQCCILQSCLSRQPCFQQQAAVFSQTGSDKPSVHKLPSPKLKTKWAPSTWTSSYRSRYFSKGLVESKSEQKGDWILNLHSSDDRWQTNSRPAFLIWLLIEPIYLLTIYL